jgi:hypothetical protein
MVRGHADKGRAWAQSRLGMIYEGGNCGVKQSYEEAVSWYRKAAYQGDVSAQYYLGGCYIEGDGVVQSYEEAARWFKKAANQGYAGSQFNLAVCFNNGDGVGQSGTEAIRLFRLSAAQGYQPAIDGLKSLGVPLVDPNVSGGVSGPVSQGSQRPPPGTKDVCCVCGVGGGAQIKLLKCGGCKKVEYCGRECQRKDWKTHKKVCRSLPSSK